MPGLRLSENRLAEYTPRKLNPTRKRLLDLHLHPIAVHFPIAGSALTVACLF